MLVVANYEGCTCYKCFTRFRKLKETTPAKLAHLLLSAGSIFSLLPPKSGSPTIYSSTFSSFRRPLRWLSGLNL